MEIESCPHCGVPKQVVEEHLWLDSSVIVLKRDQSLRMAFIECENLDPLFKGIEGLVGVPIEHIIIDAERKGCRDYFYPFIPNEIRDMLRRREITLDPLLDAMIVSGILNGVGKYEVVEYRNEMDESNYVTVRITNPHSLPIACGDLAGTSEAVSEVEHGKTSYREVSPGVYEVHAAASGIAEPLKGRLERKQYHLREGHIKLERCPSCGGPIALSNFKWHSDRGVIVNALNGKRISIVHPSVLDPVFDELEQELGEEIPRVVVEAQRRFVKTGFYSPEEIRDEERFRTQLALRGMGGLTEMSMDSSGLHLKLENACLHLMMVGMAQGIFEMAYGVESEVNWKLSEEGDLEVEVRPTT